MKRQGYLWNPEAETMPPQQRHALQGKRVHRQVERAEEYVPFYRQAFEERGVHPQDIQAIEDIERLPFTTQADMTEDLYQALGLHVHVLVVEPHRLPRSEGKVKRVVDRRQLT